MSAQSPEEVHALLEAAFNTRDIDAFLELYEQDATQVVPPDGERVSGRDALRAALEPIFALRPEARMEVVGMLQGDGLALTYGRWRLDGTDPQGNRVQLEGRGTIVSRRQPDGSWRIALDNPMAPT
jgi:uncharacterized protein (TIGR02246 family)